MMQISAVPREDVPDIWHITAPMIERALEYNADRADIIDVYAAILQNQMGMWVAFDDADGKIVGCAITSIYKTSMTNILVFEYLAGEKVDTWLDEGAEVLNRYAYDQGCSLMECKGRFGWVPRLREYGWESKAVYFEREVKTPSKTNSPEKTTNPNKEDNK